MIVYETPNRTGNTGAEFKFMDLSVALTTGFDVLKKMGAFAPVDTDNWIKTAEDEVWNDINKFEKI